MNKDHEIIVEDLRRLGLDKGDAVLVGQQVSFYMEDNPDKSGKFKRAVIVRGEYL